MSDLIRRSELRATFERECIGECGCCKHVKHDPEGCALIDSAPTVDAVEVVRCQNCLHWRRNRRAIMGGCFCECLATFRPADFYCAYGRKIPEND